MLSMEVVFINSQLNTSINITILHNIIKFTIIKDKNNLEEYNYKNKKLNSKNFMMIIQLRLKICYKNVNKLHKNKQVEEKLMDKLEIINNQKFMRLFIQPLQ